MRLKGDYLITVGHCLDKTYYFSIENETGLLPAKIVLDAEVPNVPLADGDSIALIKLPTLDNTQYHQTVKVAKYFSGRLFLACYPVILEKRMPVLRYLKWYTVDGQMLLFNNSVAGGCSGGGIFNHRNELVALVGFYSPLADISGAYLVTPLRDKINRIINEKH